MNDNFVMVGSGVGTVAGQRGWMCDLNSGVWTELLPQNPPIGWSGASGINNNNVVCGYRSIDDGGDPVNPQTAFLWSTTNGFTDLGVMSGPSSLAFHLSEDGTVVGLSGGNVISNYSRAFIWRDGANSILPPVPGGTNSAAFASTGASRVILSGMTVVNGNTYPRGWAMFDGAFIDLGILPGHLRAFPRALDDHGQIFGWCTDANVASEAFVWRNGSMLPLAALVSPSGAVIREATGVSANGLVVGNGANTQGVSAAIVLQPHLPRVGDLNCDEVVNVRDLLGVIINWGPCYGCSADFNGDGEVGYDDLLDVVANWG